MVVTGDHPTLVSAVRTVGRRAILEGYLRLRVAGAENVPTTGRVLLAANHVSYLDGPVLFGVSPRPVTFLVKAEFFDGVLGWALRGLGQVPVHQGQLDRTALVTALNALSTEQVVGIFPEGGRHDGDFASFERGVSWLAVRSGAPVVPVGIAGSAQAWPRGNRLPRPRSAVTVCFGQPIQVNDKPAAATRRAVDAAAEQLRRTLIDHLTTTNAAHREATAVGREGI